MFPCKGKLYMVADTHTHIYYIFNFFCYMMALRSKVTLLNTWYRKIFLWNHGNNFLSLTYILKIFFKCQIRQCYKCFCFLKKSRDWEILVHNFLDWSAVHGFCIFRTKSHGMNVTMLCMHIFAFQVLILGNEDIYFLKLCD